MLLFIALLLGFLLIIASGFCQSTDATKNVVVCEGELASLHCDAQHEILIDRALFGRFALESCNPNNLPDLPVDCGAEDLKKGRSVEVMKARCEHRQRCVVPVNLATFPAHFGGDPCIGTPKYLEAVYNCVRVTTTTTTTTLSTSAFSAKAANTTPIVPSFVGHGAVGSGHGHTNKITFGCPAVEESELNWPITAYGQTARVQCPRGAMGRAEWHCSATTKRWSAEEGPNLASCTSDWARELRHENKEDETGPVTSQERRDTLVDTLRDIYVKLRHADRLFGGDAKVVAKLLADLTKKAQRQEALGTTEMMLDRRHQEKRTKAREHVLDLVKLIIQTSGHLLRISQRSAWTDLSRDERRLLAQQLLTTVPQALSLLLPYGNSETLLAEPTLNCEVTQAAKIYDSVPFPFMRSFRDVDTVQLPRNALEMYNKDFANIFYMAWDHSMGNFLLGSTDDDSFNNNNGIISVAQRQFHHKHQHRLAQPRAIARLVGIAVVPLNGQLLVHPVHGRPILIIFRNDFPPTVLQHRKMVGEPRCVWWDSASSRFIDAIDASANSAAAGCTLQGRNRTHTVCECRRMNTHFTVVANFEDRTNAAGDGWEILPFASPFAYVLFRLGALIALISLLFSLLITLLVRPTRAKGELIKIELFCGHPSWHRCHITAFLLLIQIVLLNTFYGIQQHQYLCSSIALLLQFLIVAALCWTLLDALQMRGVVLHLHDTNGTISNSLLKQICLYLFGYGFPLLLVGATVFMHDLHKYVPAEPFLPDFCWLNLDLFGIYTFVGPVLALLSATIFCLAQIFFAMNSARNTKSCPPDAYHPCPNGIKNMQHSNKQRGEQRRQRVHMRQRVQWLGARCALTCVACIAAICWAYAVTRAMREEEEEAEDNAGGVGIGTLALVANSALTLSLLNTALGVQMLAEICVDKMTRVHYRQWRLNGGGFGPVSAFFTAIIDKICCCGTFILKKHSQNGIGAEFPQLKFAFSPSGAVLLENVNGCGPNSSATSSSSSGRNGGTASACSEVSTTELPVSSSGDSALLAQVGQGKCAAALPPPAALLQLYHEHKRKNSSASTNPKSNDQPASTDNTIYDYATIPYDDLSLSKQPPSAPCYRMLHQPAAAQSPMPYGMTPRQAHKASYGGKYSARGYLGNNYGGHHSPYTYTPQLVRMQQNQVQLIHPDLPMQDGTNFRHHHIGTQSAADEHHQQQPLMMMMMDVPAGEMGFNSAVLPPHIPPLGPAPVGYALPHSSVQFRHHPSPFHGGSPAMPSSSSARASSASGGGGGTLVFKMDLSRPEPVFSERIDSLDEDGEEDGEEEEDDELEQ